MPKCLKTVISKCDYKNDDVGTILTKLTRARSWAEDPHSLYADPDPAVFLNADPDPDPGLA